MWRKITFTLLSWIAFFILSQQTISAETITTLYETVETEIVAKGLTYEHRSKLTNDGWVDIHVLKMDLNEPSLALDIIRDSNEFAGVGQLSNLANENNIFVGGINGSFFNLGYVLSDAEGYEFEDENISFVRDQGNKNGYRNASLFSMLDGTFAMGFVESAIELRTATGGIIYILGVNTISDLNNPIIFNRNAYLDTERIDQIDDVYKLVVVNDIITNITGPGELTEIPENGYIVTFHENHASSILSSVRIGLGLTLDIQTNIDESQLELAISGGGLILKEGQLVEEGLIVGGNARHPRTAIGLSSDGQYLIAMVVDGRGESMGATHFELAEYLKEYDVDTAMHMDGGGSSTLTAKSLGENRLSSMNTPSDGQERQVVNGLGFVSNAEKTNTLNLQLKTDNQRVFINSTIDLSLVAYDSNFNAVEVLPDRVAWSLAGGYGRINQTAMTFTPLQAGEIIMSAYYQGQETKLVLMVVDELIDLQISPKVVYYEDGITEFVVTGIDTEGYVINLNNEMVTWEMDEVYGSITNGVFIGKENDTIGTIEIKYKDIKEVAYMTSVSLLESDIDLSNVTVTPLVYPSFVEGEAAKELINGHGITIGYQFVASDVSQAVYAQFETLSLIKPVERLILSVEEMPEDVLVKAHIEDHYGETLSVTFNEENGQMVAYLPSSLSYPIEIKRIYVVTLPREIPISGTLQVHTLSKATITRTLEDKDIRDYPPKDALYAESEDPDYSIKIFGATAGRNRLLDQILLEKVYDELNAADFSIYAGMTNVDTSRITNETLMDSNEFSIVDLEDVRIVSLAMATGSMVKTDATQWSALNAMLSSTMQKSIIIIGTESLTNNVDKSFTKEGLLIHERMSNYVKKSGKTIFYVNASGYGSGLNYFEGIRYIDVNGLWYKIEDNRSVDLYDSFKVVNFSVTNRQLTYTIEDLYPKTTVN